MSSTSVKLHSLNPAPHHRHCVKSAREPRQACSCTHSTSQALLHHVAGLAQCQCLLESSGVVLAVVGSHAKHMHLVRCVRVCEYMTSKSLLVLVEVSALPSKGSTSRFVTPSTLFPSMKRPGRFKPCNCRPRRCATAMYNKPRVMGMPACCCSTMLMQLLSGL